MCIRDSRKTLTVRGAQRAAFHAGAQVLDASAQLLQGLLAPRILLCGSGLKLLPFLIQRVNLRLVSDQIIRFELLECTLTFLLQLLKLCDLTDRSRVVAGDSMEFLKAAREKYDLIFLDPPYETELLETAIAHIARHDLLNVHGMMIAEHPVDKVLPALSAPYRMGRTYRYGKIAVTIYHRDGDEGAQV